MKQLKRELGIWQWQVGFVRCYEVLPKAWRLVFMIFKLIKFPEEGSYTKKGYYKGVFWISKRIIWHPITLLKRFLDKRFPKY